MSSGKRVPATGMSLVLDISVTLAWVYADETTDAVCRVFQSVASSGAWVPALWCLEVANVLETNVRRRRHDSAFRDNTLADLSVLPIQSDPETHEQAWDATARLAERHLLTLYDAAYLELALRRGLPLATLDEALRKAGKKEKVGLLGV
jgi:predicted nucleic acid-binding protein